jgi:hypothetical protein
MKVCGGKGMINTGFSQLFFSCNYGSKKATLLPFIIKTKMHFIVISSIIYFFISSLGLLLTVLGGCWFPLCSRKLVILKCLWPEVLPHKHMEIFFQVHLMNSSVRLQIQFVPSSCYNRIFVPLPLST